MAHMQPSQFIGGNRGKWLFEFLKSFCLEHLGCNTMENNDILYTRSETEVNSNMLIEKMNNSVIIRNNDNYHCLIF